jgi:hypothetical protein
VLCGDARPHPPRHELVTDAESQEAVAQCAVRGYHDGGARREVGCRSVVFDDCAVYVIRGVADQRGDVLGLGKRSTTRLLEVQLWRGFGDGEFTLHVIA